MDSGATNYKATLTISADNVNDDDSDDGQDDE